MASKNRTTMPKKPNFLILCIDQWDRHMELPEDLELPALQRLEAEGISFERQYCTTPICTPSRATMWTGVHAKEAGLWDNTNFAWIDELSTELPTIGHMMRDQGYYTAFKGKWHLSEVPRGEGALEEYGFADFQQWGDRFGGPLEGEMVDGAIAFETADWLETRPGELDKPWLLVSSLINPHDVMFLQTDPVQEADQRGAFRKLLTRVQNLGWFEQEWDISLPANFDDDFDLQPEGVRAYKAFVDANYGRIPDDREDLWLKHRNYLINAMRLVDAQFLTILRAMDEQDLWENTVVIYTSDHGEMNGAHRMTQKGAIPFDEATVVNLTVRVPGGPKGEKTGAVGSHLDLAPTLLDFAGVSKEERQRRYPQLKGRSLKGVVLGEDEVGPRGSREEPGDGALICWDGLHSLDVDWALTGALGELTDMGQHPQEAARSPEERLKEVGRRYGAPDFSKRTFFRAIVDGRYKLVRWFSPREYANPDDLEELYELSDVALYDLEEDPGELENLAHPEHRRHDLRLVQEMMLKLHALIKEELGEDRRLFELEIFGEEPRPPAGEVG